MKSCIFLLILHNFFLNWRGKKRGRGKEDDEAVLLPSKCLLSDHWSEGWTPEEDIRNDTRQESRGGRGGYVVVGARRDVRKMWSGGEMEEEEKREWGNSIIQKNPKRSMFIVDIHNCEGWLMVCLVRDIKRNTVKLSSKISPQRSHHIHTRRRDIKTSFFIPLSLQSNVHQNSISLWHPLSSPLFFLIRTTNHLANLM